MDFCCDNTLSHITQWLPSVTTKSQERDPTLSHAHLKKKKKLMKKEIYLS
jgi:hypothetical protein